MSEGFLEELVRERDRRDVGHVPDRSSFADPKNIYKDGDMLRSDPKNSLGLKRANGAKRKKHVTNLEIAEAIANQEGTVAHCVSGDSGGWTSAGGISSRYLRMKYPGLSHKESEDMARRLSMAQAAEILEEDFVEPLSALAPCLRGPVASCAVNMGMAKAVRILQKVLVNSNADRDLVVDGIMGPKTEYAACERFPQDIVAVAFCAAWDMAYVKIVHKKPTQRHFLRGWLNRVEYWLNRIT